MKDRLLNTKLILSFKNKCKEILFNIKNSIRLELILAFALCFIIAFVIGKITGNLFQETNKTARIDYSKGIDEISVNAAAIADKIKNKNMSINDNNEIQSIIDKGDYTNKQKIMITDLKGKVLYKSQNTYETQIDIYSTIKNSIKNYVEFMKNIQDIYNKGDISTVNENREYISFYPLNFKDENAYLVMRGIPRGKIIYENIYNPVPQIIASIMAFLLLFYFMTNKKIKYIDSIASGLIEISKGNLDYKIKREGKDELTILADNINFMADELHSKIKHERDEERIKNELITNVSHDLRTPLTSIKGYLGLLKDKKYKTDEELKQYINIAYNKSEKLELLINDLFEYTKLTNNAVVMDKENIFLNDLLDQLIEEMVPIFEENNVSIVKKFSSKRLKVNLDPNRTVRVFENLLVNAVRYCTKPGNIIVSLEENGNFAVCSIENKCDIIKEDDVDKLFDRFFRVDKSRASDTGGSGLGLAIAKNIVEHQGGRIRVDYDKECIRFNVVFELV